MHPQVPAGALLMVHTATPSTALGAAAWPHLSSWRTRLRSRSRAARSSSLSGLADKQPVSNSPWLHLSCPSGKPGAAPFLPLRYLLFALFLATAAAADTQHDKDHSSHHRHRNDQGFKVHCRMQAKTLSTQIPSCWEVAVFTAMQELQLLDSRHAGVPGGTQDRRYF